MVRWRHSTPSHRPTPPYSRSFASNDDQILASWGHRDQHGEGSPRSLEKAIRLHYKAAKGGNVDAQYQLGSMYAKGMA